MKTYFSIWLIVEDEELELLYMEIEDEGDIATGSSWLERLTRIPKPANEENKSKDKEETRRAPLTSGLIFLNGFFIFITSRTSVVKLKFLIQKNKKYD